MTSLGLNIATSKDNSVHTILDHQIHIDIMLLGFHVLVNVIQPATGAPSLTRLLPVRMHNGKPCIGSAQIDHKETPWIDFDNLPEDIEQDRYDLAFTQAFRRFLEANTDRLLYLARLRGGDSAVTA
jgi:hypothetical protein